MIDSKRATFLGLSAVAVSAVLATSAWAAKEPLKIGVPTSLTGPYSQLGDEVKRAVEFAVNEANAAGGVDGRRSRHVFSTPRPSQTSPASRPKSSPSRATTS